MSGKPTLVYSYKGNIYINLTNRCTLECIFCPKRSGNSMFRGMNLEYLPGSEPKVAEIVQALRDRLAEDPTPGEVVFAGLGEPTLRLDVLLDVARTILPDLPRGTPLRVITDGLANLRQGRDVTPELAQVVQRLSVSLNAADGAHYNRLCPSPYGAAAHGALLSFLCCAGATSMEVTATAVGPQEGVDLEACKQIVDGIPGVRFKVRPYEPAGFLPDSSHQHRSTEHGQ